MTVAGCGDRIASDVKPSPAGDPAVTAGFTLSGTVFDHTSGTPEPRPGVLLRINVPNTDILLVSDRTGRYRIHGIPRAAVWVAPPLDSEYRAPCPGGAALLGSDLLIDVHVVSAVSLAANGIPSTIPRTSVWFAGSIFETVSGNRRPVGGATVDLDNRVATFSDALGHYTICSAPPDAAAGLTMTLSVSRESYLPASRQVASALGQSGVDVELTRR